MINCAEFELDRIAKVMTALRGKIDRTDYFEKGTLLEKAVATYSGGQLTRINEEGRDFRDRKDKTYEQKIATIKKKPRGGPQISNFIIKNWQGETRDFSESMMADYYIFMDVENLKMCVVPREFIQIKQTKAANVTACCDPLPEHFIELPEVEVEKSFFKLKEDWIKSYLDSI